ncbi:DNA-directed RNA polymerase subunit beta' [subsurface metagenome]
MLTEAVLYGRVDKLIGLKENVIIGKLIPAYYPLSKEVPGLVAGEESEERLTIEEGKERLTI